MNRIKAFFDKIIFVIFNTLFLGMGIYSLFTILFDSGCNELKSYLDYQIYDAEIISISVERSRRNDFLKEFRYYIKAKYQYHIDGKRFVSNKVGLGKPQWFDYHDAQKQLENITFNPKAYVGKSNESILIEPIQFQEINTVSVWFYPGLYIGLMILAGFYSPPRKKS